MEELTTSIVGIDFPNEDKSKSNRREEIMLCAPGDPVELRPEPKNPYDSNAIAVWSERGVQMGYISAERTPLVGKRVQVNEAAAVFQGLSIPEPISGSGSGAGCPPGPLPQPNRSSRHPRRGGYVPDPDRSLILRRCIRMRTAQDSARKLRTNANVGSPCVSRLVRRAAFVVAHHPCRTPSKFLLSVR